MYTEKGLLCSCLKQRHYILYWVRICHMMIMRIQYKIELEMLK